jgi:hypothetical protein
MDTNLTSVSMVRDYQTGYIGTSYVVREQARTEPSGGEYKAFPMPNAKGLKSLEGS